MYVITTRVTIPDMSEQIRFMGCTKRPTLAQSAPQNNIQQKYTNHIYLSQIVTNTQTVARLLTSYLPCKLRRNDFTDPDFTDFYRLQALVF